MPRKIRLNQTCRAKSETKNHLRHEIQITPFKTRDFYIYNTRYQITPTKSAQKNIFISVLLFIVETFYFQNRPKMFLFYEDPLQKQSTLIVRNITIICIEIQNQNISCDQHIASCDQHISPRFSRTTIGTACSKYTPKVDHFRPAKDATSSRAINSPPLLQPLQGVNINGGIVISEKRKFDNKKTFFPAKIG